MTGHHEKLASVENLDSKPIKFFRLWKRICKKTKRNPQLTKTAHMYATRITNLVNDTVTKGGKVLIRVRLDDQNFGLQLEKNALLSWHKLISCQLRNRYYGEADLVLSSRGPDWAGKVDGLKPPIDKNLVAQVSIAAYPCQHTEIKISPGSIRSIKYLTK